MKYLVLCEGSNERAVMDVLLDNDLVCIRRDELIDRRVFCARQLDRTIIKNVLQIYTGDFSILRIGDKQGDKLKIPADYKGRIIDVQKFCTLPELEILLIIAEGKWGDYQKYKSKTSPKEYAKKNIVYSGRKYDNSAMFYELYFGKDPEKLVRTIREYRRLHKKHDSGQGYLDDLLKQ